MMACGTETGICIGVILGPESFTGLDIIIQHFSERPGIDQHAVHTDC